MNLPATTASKSTATASEALTSLNGPAETGPPQTRKLTEPLYSLTRRHWSHTRRAAIFVNWSGGAVDSRGRAVPTGRAPELLDLLGLGFSIVYLCGADPQRIKSWSLLDPPEGWSMVGAWHDDQRPAGTWREGLSGQRVRITSAQSWVGSADAVAAAAAWSWIEGRVAELFPGGELLRTPGLTGADLIARSVPRGVEYAPLIGDLQAEIRETSTQGRTELFGIGTEVAGLVEVDMRLAYAATCWGLPVGEPVRMIGEPDPYDPHCRMRVRARWSAPVDWTGPGILPERGADRWYWPRSGQGWIDASELRLARLHGWRVEVSESIVWPTADRSDPLKQWRTKLVALFSEVEAATARRDVTIEVGRAARTMVRAMILHALGSLQGRSTTVTRTLPVDQASEVPAGVSVDLVGDLIVWREQLDPSWPEMAHPEWTAVVWARTRCRLLEARGAARPGEAAPLVGALHLPAGVELIGCRNDALYLSTDPRWHDDGKPGRYRVKGAESVTPFVVPAAMQQLDQYRRDLAGGFAPRVKSTAIAASIEAAREALV